MSVVNRLFMPIILVLACHAVRLEAASLTLPRVAQAVHVSADQQRRLTGWQRFVQRHRHASWQQKLHLANGYLNQFDYQKDKPVRGKAESWATPYEFILQNGGDCEDFAIAKYFLLRALGIPEGQLQVTYVYHHLLKQNHMVLMYRPSEHAPVLVLDNLTNRIQPLADRPDIEPVYGFNRHHLWVVDRAAQRTEVGGPTRLLRWQALLGRMRWQPLGPVDAASG